MTSIPECESPLEMKNNHNKGNTPLKSKTPHPPLLVKASSETLGGSSDDDNNSLSDSSSSNNNDFTSATDGQFASSSCTSKATKSITTTTATTTSSLEWVAYGCLTAVVVGIFSTYFPFYSDPTLGVMAPIIYQPARYHYDPAVSRFDNTFLTYGTDYILCAVMTAWAISIHAGAGSAAAAHPNTNANVQERAILLQNHVFRSRGLLMTYALSVLAGGLAHQFFTTNEMHNTLLFRFLWTVCVGSVTAASGWMGSIGSNWVRYDQTCTKSTSGSMSSIPMIPASFWIAYAVITTTVVMAGGWSYQRPAADIFVAGITQFPSTFYVMALMWKGLPTLSLLSKYYRVYGCVAWILNAPLLPAYPYLVMILSPNLGHVNGILHLCLCIAWSCQGHTLRTVAQAMVMDVNPPNRAVPMKVMVSGTINNNNTKKLQ